MKSHVGAGPANFHSQVAFPMRRIGDLLQHEAQPLSHGSGTCTNWEEGKTYGEITQKKKFSSTQSRTDLRNGRKKEDRGRILNSQIICGMCTSVLDVPSIVVSISFMDRGEPLLARLSSAALWMVTGWVVVAEDDSDVDPEPMSLFPCPEELTDPIVLERSSCASAGWLCCDCCPVLAVKRCFLKVSRISHWLAGWIVRAIVGRGRRGDGMIDEGPFAWNSLESIDQAKTDKRGHLQQCAVNLIPISQRWASSSKHTQLCMKTRIRVEACIRANEGINTYFLRRLSCTTH